MSPSLPPATAARVDGRGSEAPRSGRRRAVSAALVAGLVGLVFAPPSSAADSTPGRAPIEIFAEAMARLDFGAAWEALARGDREAMAKEAFVARYEALAKAPFVAAVLRSARVVDGRIEAIDWEEARLLRAGLAGKSASFEPLRRRFYSPRGSPKGVRLGLGPRARRERRAGRALEGTALRGQGDADWFARYVVIRGRCGRGADYVLARVRGEGVDEALCVPCAGAPSDALVLPTDRDSKALRGASLSIEARLTQPAALDPFTAPPPAIVLEPVAALGY